ncbi:hypothetical protein JHK87_044080 [Glycine soja]|nr:hypothetical protein JHK87_044080 [Glycine soja]
MACYKSSWMLDCTRLIAKLLTMKILVFYCHERLYNCKGLIRREEEWRWKGRMTSNG